MSDQLPRRARGLIYVVDDEPSIRRYLDAALHALGCDVALFGEAATCVEAVRKTRPDVVIMDWLMPGLSQRAALKALRAAGAPCVVVCSALVVPDEVERMRAAEPDDFLPKPCTLEDIEAGLKRWLV